MDLNWRDEVSMKLVRNTGTDRVMDVLRPWLLPGRNLDIMSSQLSLFASSETDKEISALTDCRLLLPGSNGDIALLGAEADRKARNRLQNRWLASRLATWIAEKTKVKRAAGPVPRGAFVIRDSDGPPLQAILGSVGFSTDGLGITPGNPVNLVQASETSEEARLLSQWFDSQWAKAEGEAEAKAELLDVLRSLAAHREPSIVYALILHHVFRSRGDDLDEGSLLCYS